MDKDWIDCKTVYLAVKTEYDRLDYNGEHWAPSTIIERLKSGAMVARATHIELSNDLRTSSYRDIDDYFSAEFGADHLVLPRQFWQHLDIDQRDTTTDWIAGDFSVDQFDDPPFNHYLGRVQGIFFLNKNLPAIGTLKAAANRAAMGKGRPPANWWPKFAEELAVHIHNFGIPEGTGAEGQSELIDAVFSAMNERGEEEPTRTTVQPVINAVLSRIRSAGK